MPTATTKLKLPLSLTAAVANQLSVSDIYSWLTFQRTFHMAEKQKASFLGVNILHNATKALGGKD